MQTFSFVSVEKQGYWSRERKRSMNHMKSSPVIKPGAQRWMAGVSCYQSPPLKSIWSLFLMPITESQILWRYRELSFRKGDIINVRRQVDKNWIDGELNGRRGIFPTNYVEVWFFHLEFDEFVIKHGRCKKLRTYNSALPKSWIFYSRLHNCCNCFLKYEDGSFGKLYHNRSSMTYLLSRFKTSSSIPHKDNIAWHRPFNWCIQFFMCRCAL